MNIDFAIVARDLRLPPEKIERSVQLLDDGNTIPFITRFRKDQTGGLNEEQLLAIKKRVASLRSLAERKAFVVKSIESQDKLTDELAAEINKANTSRRLEDLYHPFKAKKQSRAQTARHQGLEPLAEEIFSGTNPEVDMSTRATDYVRVDKGLTSVDDVIKGVGDLLAERFSEDSELRSKLRKILWATGSLTSQLIPPNDNSASQGSQAGNKTKKKVKAEVEKTANKEKSVNPTAKKPTVEKPTAEKPKDEKTKDVQSKPAEIKTDAVASQEDSAAVKKETASEAIDSEATPTATDNNQAAVTESKSDNKTPENQTADEKITDSGETKSNFKMSADGEADQPNQEPSPEPLKPVEPEAKPPTSIAPEQKESPVVADTPAPATENKAAESATEEKPAAEEKPTAAIEPAASITSATAATAAPAKTVATDTKPATDAKPTAEKATAEKATATKTKPKKKKKKKKKKTDTAFKDYYSFKQSLKSLPNHQVLAINRGERANRLRVKIAYDEKQVTDTAIEHLIKADHPFKTFLEKCVHDALNRLVIPSLEREIRRELTEKSEKHAVDVFATNLKNLLLTPPLRGRRVMAIDPGFKSGCSVAVLDNQGQFVASDHLFVVGNKERREESCKKVGELVKEHNVDMIAIGNGVGCRETEQMVSDAIANSLTDHPVRYVIINEAGTSVYSTSEVGREELPDQTPAVRSAISIGRRLQNPISELVKISPANIGVGMYQHDIKAKHLSESLDEVVQFCVNRVGVDVNSASPSLLAFVSGMNALTARRVYEHRKQNGPFKNRQQLKEVSGLGDTTFIQSAGFLRIRDGDNPLDSTSIHPESYPIAEDIISRVDSTPEELFASRKSTPKVDEPADKPADNKATEEQTAATPPVEDASTETAAESASPETPAAETPAAETSPSTPAETSPSTPAETTPTETAPSTPTPDNNPSWSAKRKEIIGRLLALDVDAIAAEKNVGKLLMTDLIRAIKKPMWDPRDKISKPISRRGIVKADELKPEMQLEAQVVNVVDFGVFVDIGLSDSCLVHVSQLSTRYISDPQLVYAIGNILKVWVTEVDAERRRVKLTAIRPGTKKAPSHRRRPSKPQSGGAPGGQDKGRSKRRDGKPAHAKFERKKTVRRPPKPKPVIPITDEMLKGDAPMRSFSDLLQFKKKTPDDQKKNSES